MHRLYFVIMFITVLAVSGCEQNEQPVESVPVETGMLKIVAVGDSLTAGYGLAESAAYPARLSEKLKDAGYRVEVINSGVSAETSSGTLARLDWVMTLDPDIVILEIGANDGLRGIDTSLLESNLRKIIERFKEKDVKVVLAGMQMVWNLGPLYVKRFNKIYPELAEEYDLIFMPFFLEDVAMQQNLNQSDGVHPSAEGYKVIAENIYPYVVEAIDSLEK